MANLSNSIDDNYSSKNLYENIINGLKKQGVSLDKVSRSDISGVDEFHVYGKVVSRELANNINLNGATVLDVGCGIGGPCRMLADEYNCKTTGIDLSHDYIETATKLSELVNLSNKTTFLQADATELPFENNTFNVVWTQHVQMNIKDKKKLYSEVNRVLKTGGYFLYYDVFKICDKEISYPTPWADNSRQSFLFETLEMDIILKEIGFTEILSTNYTQKGIKVLNPPAAKPIKAKVPKLGLKMLMGETTKLKLTNLLYHLKNNDLELISGVYRK